MKISKFQLTLPSVIIGISIFILTSIPSEYLPELEFILWDKLAHLFIFFLFGASLVIAFTPKVNKVQESKIIIAIFLIGSIYSFLDELHQIYVPGRICDFYDWLFSAVGIVISILIRKKIWNFVNKKLLKNGSF